MATATVGCEIILPLTAATPWWKRRDTYALAAVASLHVVAVGPALWMWEEGFLQIGGDSGVMDQLLEGAVIGQCFLLSIWGALGGLRTIVRWGIVGGVYLLAVACFGFCFRSELDVAVQCLEVGLIGGIVVTSFAVVMLPLRGLAGWRVDFDVANYDHIRSRRGQLSFVDFAALSCAVAVPLTLMRLAGESSEETAVVQWCDMLSGLAIVGLTAAPSCYVVLAWRWSGLAVVAAGAWALVLGSAEGLLSWWLNESDIIGNPATWLGAWLGAIAFHGAIAVACGGTLAALRLCGLQLLVVGLSQRQADALREQTTPQFTLQKAA